MTDTGFPGAVSELWRYPVSSMGGERLARAPVTDSGIVGDRIWGLVDADTGRVASPGREKHFIEVPKGHSRYGGTGDEVAISPDGTNWTAPDDDVALQALSGLFGFRPLLKRFAPVGGDGFRPRYEHAPLHLLTTAAMRTLGRDVPGSIVESRRFRPNIVVDWPDGSEAMPEMGWIGREIRVGDVVLRGIRPCGRCGFITLEQEGLPVDVALLRTVVKRYERNFGIYCEVVSAGQISPGDAVSIAG